MFLTKSISSSNLKNPLNRAFPFPGFFNRTLFQSSRVTQNRSSKVRDKIKIGKNGSSEEENAENQLLEEFAVPSNLENFLKNSHGRKGKRDKIQEKKVERLRNIHLRSKLPHVQKPSISEKISLRQKRIAELAKNALENTMNNFRGVTPVYYGPSLRNVGSEPIPESSRKLLQKARVLIENVEVAPDLRTTLVSWSTYDIQLKDSVRKELQKKEIIRAIRAQTTEQINHIRYALNYKFVNSDDNRNDISIDVQGTGRGTHRKNAAEVREERKHRRIQETIRVLDELENAMLSKGVEEVKMKSAAKSKREVVEEDEEEEEEDDDDDEHFPDEEEDEDDHFLDEDEEDEHFPDEEEDENEHFPDEEEDENDHFPDEEEEEEEKPVKKPTKKKASNRKQESVEASNATIY